MARNQDKIQLPTNSTDIVTLVRYLKEIKKEGKPLTNETAQDAFKRVKASGKRGKASDKKDTHTAGTLSKYSLIEYVDEKGKEFVISALAEELIAMYEDDGSYVKKDGKQIYSEEEYQTVNLKIFMAWHETTKGRDIHPGMIILRLMTEEELDYYVSEHDVAYFTSNPKFVSDEQYDEIKQYIIEFRNNYDGVFGKTKKPCKADIFMPTFVSNWRIFEKKAICDIKEDPSEAGRFLIIDRSDIDAFDMTTEDGSDELEGENEAELEEMSAENEMESEEIENSDEDADNGLGINISFEDLYKTLTKYTLTKQGEIFCGVVFGYKRNVDQIVYFGAPGTGKSFSIDERMTKERVASENQARVIFYPDYTYGDFVGTLKPVRDALGVDYTFVAGEFTVLLETAYKNPRDSVYLLIEEINRGSAAGIFGDLFQLLDRRKDGRSKYDIKNENVCSVLMKDKSLKPFFGEGNIWLPSNFNILCTMNTADQNVFILDSAFKRRFHMKYVPISFTAIYTDKELAGYLEETNVFESKKGELLIDIFNDTELAGLVKELDSEGKLKRNWPTFAKLVNATIDIINKNEGDQISEDKKLGPFYVLEDEINDREKFADKVVYYLKQDVFKYIENYFIESYQVIYDRICDGEQDLFKLLVPGDE